MDVFLCLAFPAIYFYNWDCSNIDYVHSRIWIHAQRHNKSMQNMIPCHGAACVVRWCSDNGSEIVLSHWNGLKPVLVCLGKESWEYIAWFPTFPLCTAACVYMINDKCAVNVKIVRNTLRHVRKEFVNSNFSFLCINNNITSWFFVFYKEANCLG